jgi:hypothetical protein
MKTIILLLLSGVASAQTYDISGFVGPETFAGAFTYSNGVLTSINVSDGWGSGTFTLGSAGGDSITLVNWFGQNPNAPGQSITEPPAYLTLTLSAPLGSSNVSIINADYAGGVGNVTDDFACGQATYGAPFTCGGTVATAAPEMDAATAIAALTFLFGGLMVLRSPRQSPTLRWRVPQV